ncbi:hypothetical protein BST61_g7544 [Cercospora zeina]
MANRRRGKPPGCPRAERPHWLEEITKRMHHNCTSTGRQCGYAESTPKSRPDDGTSLSNGRLAPILGLRDDEKRTFSYFLSHTAPRLAQKILTKTSGAAMCFKLPTRSLSSWTPCWLCQRYGVQSSLVQRPPDGDYARALKHYNRAISRFRKKMGDGSATPLLAMLTSVRKA